MEALIMAGGKGTRLCKNGVEKPYINVAGKHVIEHVINALKKAKCVDRILVTVSPNTKKTEEFLMTLDDVEIIRSSGEDYVGDLHAAYSVMNGKYVFSTPSDLPLLKSFTVDNFIKAFEKDPHDSFLAVVDEEVVVNTGIVPSFSFEMDGSKWVLSGLTIMNRQMILDGECPPDYYYKTDWVDLAVNVNTMYELQLARGYFG